MSNTFPSSVMLWRAINIYMKRAYDGRPPAAVRGRLEKLAQHAAESLSRCPVLEQNPQTGTNRYSIRLGNRTYPHMKLTIERINQDSGFFFKADTHDRHCRPPAHSPEYKAFLALMESNEAVSKLIESDWSLAGIPTFRQFLRDDLVRRQAAAQKSS